MIPLKVCNGTVCSLRGAGLTQIGFRAADRLMVVKISLDGPIELTWIGSKWTSVHYQLPELTICLD